MKLPVTPTLHALQGNVGPTPSSSARGESTPGILLLAGDTGMHCHMFIVSRKRSNLSSARDFHKDNRTELGFLFFGFAVVAVVVIVLSVFLWSPC